MSFLSKSAAFIGLIVFAASVGSLIWVDANNINVSYVVPTPVYASTTPVMASAQPYGFATSDGITFEIATSTAKQERGLGGRESIPDNYGMLFVFAQDSTYGFWMKDMLTSIDMIWLSDTGTIVSITYDATPASYPNSFYPPVPVRYVLETKVGLAAEKGWKIGTKIPLPLPYGNSVSK